MTLTEKGYNRCKCRTYMGISIALMVLGFGSLIMGIVILARPDIVYSEPIVNVQSGNHSTVSFMINCYVYRSDDKMLELLAKCSADRFINVPVCSHFPIYAKTVVSSCNTGYLETYKGTYDPEGVNIAGVTSIVLIFGAFILIIIGFVFMYCVTNIN